MIKGAWWHSPSILEPMPGPWAGYEIYGMDPVEAWKRILNWHHDNGLDVVITHISSHFKDRTVLGWGFQYVLDFRKYPEAKTFSDDFVGRNAERMAAITSYAASLGIRLYLHHYNFMAPKNFVTAHENLHEKWNINASRLPQLDMGSSRVICDRIGTLYGNICWREPVYKQFMVSVWNELFERFPDVHGIVTTPGENQYCLCPDCTRGAASSELNELFRARNEIKHGFLSDFVRTFRLAMAANQKHAIMRLWGIKQSQEDGLNESLYPKDMTYMAKYRWFDAVDAGPDPLLTDMLQAGYEVWASDDLWGENAGPVEWNRPLYFRKLVQDSERAGCAGLISHQNNDWCTAAIPGWVQQLNLKCFCRYLADPEDDGSWVAAEYEAKFGKAGRTIGECVEEYSEFVLNISKLFIVGGEGYTFSLAHPFFPGIGTIGREVPEWVRGDVGEIREALDYASAHGWEDDLFEEVYKDRISPFDVLQSMIGSAESALSRLSEVRQDVPVDALGEFGFICTSARMCLHQAEEYLHASRAKVFYSAWTAESRQDVRQMLSENAIREMEQAVQARYALREDVLELPTSSLDFSRTLRSGTGYSYLMDSWHGLNIDLRENELSRLRELVGRGEHGGQT